MIDLMTGLGWPIVVAARSSLGTINHSLLTLEALRRRSLWILGVVMVGDKNPENRAAIEHYGRVAVLGEMPRFDPLTPDRVKRWALSELDQEYRLQAGL
jgi:malonyl-CoA O-methyltransferase